MGVDPVVIAKGDVNETTLVCAHRRKIDRRVLTHGAGGGGAGHGDDLVMTAALVALDIHGHGIAETEAAADVNVGLHYQQEQLLYIWH